MGQNSANSPFLIVSLAVLAGYLDAIGFVGFGGLFVSSMSADTTLLGVSLAEGNQRAGLAAGLILAFTFGVFLGSMVHYRAQRYSRASVLVLFIALLTIATAIGVAGMPVSCVLTMTLAVGAANAVIERNAANDNATQPAEGGRDSTLQATTVVAAMSLSTQFLSWFGFVTGAICGAASYGFLGIKSLWLAVLFATLLGLWTAISEAAKR